MNAHCLQSGASAESRKSGDRPYGGSRLQVQVLWRGREGCPLLS